MAILPKAIPNMKLFTELGKKIILKFIYNHKNPKLPMKFWGEENVG